MDIRDMLSRMMLGGQLPPNPLDPLGLRGGDGGEWSQQRQQLNPAQQAMWEALNVNDHTEFRRILAAHPGIDVNFQSNEGGFSPMHLAAMRNQADVLELLMKVGGDVEVRSPITRESPLLVASCHACDATIRLLLKHGANPHLADWHGNTPLSRTAAKARMGGRWQEAHKLIQEAVSKSMPLSRAAKRESGCGGCGRTDGKLNVCSRCGLRSYCSRECQVQDYSAHKQRCKAVGEFRKQLAVLADPAGDLEERRSLMKRFEWDEAARRMCIEVKGIKQLLDMMPSDPPVLLKYAYGGVREEYRLLSLCAVTTSMIEREGPAALPPHPKAAFHYKDAEQQFASARGMEVVLERVLAGDCPPGERVNGIRMLSALCQGHQEQVVPRLVVSKGRATAVIKLLARLLTEHGATNAIFANACICLAALALMEGPSFEKLTQQAGEGSAAGGSGGGGSSRSSEQQQGGDDDDGELGPVAAAIFEHVDLKAISKRLISADGVAQAPPELLLVLSRSKPAFERLMSDPDIQPHLLGAFYADLFMASPTAYGPALDFWTIAHYYQPGLLVSHWDQVQAALKQALGAAPSQDSPPFVMAVIDAMFPQQAVDTAQQGAYVSTRHALKAARLMSAVMNDPNMPRTIYTQLVDCSAEVVAAVEECEDDEAAEVLRWGMAAFIPKLQKMMREGGGNKKKKGKKKGRR